MTSWLAATNEFDVQIKSITTYSLMAFFISMAVLCTVVMVSKMFMDHRNVMRHKDIELKRLEVQHANADRDQMVIRNGYQKNADGSIEPVGKVDD